MTRRKYSLLSLTFFLFILYGWSQPSENGLTINLTFSQAIKHSVKPDGRLFIFFTQHPNVEPRTQTWPNPWIKTHIFAKNITGLSTDQTLVLDADLDWNKTADWTFRNIPDGEYYVQTLWDQDQIESNINAPGNLYSEKKKISIKGKSSLDLTIANSIPERKLVEHELVRYVEYKSDTLSKWWKKPMFLKASVLLPPNFNQKKAPGYPVRYNVAGYGGRYDRVNRLVSNENFMTWWKSDESPEIINVFLDGEGPFGDSYQMDSENSGPYGYALIHELIPYIEAEFGGVGTAQARFVDGCSTGGWVSLGLQFFYPDYFGGAFSYSPDAVEFENYQLINIYKDQNAYINEAGYLRPVMRDVSGEPLLSLREFIQYENVLGSSDTYLNSGGQFSAHTALYSPKGDNGLPRPLIDPRTGSIDPDVAEHWKKYDFKLHLEREWETLGPKLDGKIFIWMGDMDQFYLNGATRKLAQFLEKIENPKSDAEIIFTPMEGHCSQYSHKAVLEKIQEKL